MDIRTQPAAGQVRDSNRFAIAGALAQAGAVVKHFPIAPDDAERFTQILREALTQADAVVLSGGSSVGQSDLTPRIVASLGEPGVIVHGLRVRPGKPTMLGCVNGKPILGLPGNPASALLIFHAVGLPIVAELTGAKVWHAEVEAEFAQHYSKRPGWTWFVPVRLEEMPGRCVAHPLELRSSSASLAARASGFCTLGEAVETVREGEKVWVRRFSSF